MAIYKDRDEFVKDQSTEALNFQITMLIGYVASSVLTAVYIRRSALPLVWIVSLVFSIIGGNGGQQGRAVPLPVRATPDQVGRLVSRPTDGGTSGQQCPDDGVGEQPAAAGQHDPPRPSRVRSQGRAGLDESVGDQGRDSGAAGGVQVGQGQPLGQAHPSSTRSARRSASLSTSRPAAGERPSPSAWA